MYRNIMILESELAIDAELLRKDIKGLTKILNDISGNKHPEYDQLQKQKKLQIHTNKTERNKHESFKYTCLV